MTAAAPPGAQWLAAAGPPGWFGKLACLGDFGSRRLPLQLTQACDQWLSRGVAGSQALLGERWLDAYLTAPVWRFAWAPGVVNSQWWLGVLMPSVDRVGRYFPLLVAQASFSPPLTPRALAQAEHWFAQVQAVMLGTLQAGATVEAFDAALTTLSDWDDGAGRPLPEPQTGTTTAASMNAARRFQLAKHKCATSVPSATMATRNFTPEQASATSNSPAGVSMNTPSTAAGTPLA